jgi:hypothetical protein
LGPVQLRLDSGAAVAGVSGPRIAGHQREIAAGVNLEDSVAAAEIRIAFRIDGDAARLPDLNIRRSEGRGGRRAAGGSG